MMIIFLRGRIMMIILRGRIMIIIIMIMTRRRRTHQAILTTKIISFFADY